MIPKELGTVIVSTVVTLGFFLSLGLFVYLRMNPPDRIDPGIDAVLNIMVGALGAGFTSVVMYYVGSSVGSKRKDEILGGQDQNADKS